VGNFGAAPRSTYQTRISGPEHVVDPHYGSESPTDTLLPPAVISSHLDLNSTSPTGKRIFSPEELAEMQGLSPIELDAIDRKQASDARNQGQQEEAAARPSYEPELSPAGAKTALNSLERSEARDSSPELLIDLGKGALDVAKIRYNTEYVDGQSRPEDEYRKTFSVSYTIWMRVANMTNADPCLLYS
jgi:nucleoid-associated protein YgaU